MTAPFSRRGALALPLLAFVGPVAAQAPGDPIDAVKDFYARANDRNDSRFMSRRLAGLFAAQRRRARRMDSPLSGLDADYLCGCQEEEDNWKATLRYELVSRTERAARVLVKFKNFDERQATFSLIVENGRWTIDDIHHAGGEPHSRLLQRRD